MAAPLSTNETHRGSIHFWGIDQRYLYVFFDTCPVYKSLALNDSKVKTFHDLGIEFDLGLDSITTALKSLISLFSVLNTICPSHSLRSFIPSRLTKLHQTLVVKREWAGLVLPSGTGWESPVTIFLLHSFLLVSFNKRLQSDLVHFPPSNC